MRYLYLLVFALLIYSCNNNTTSTKPPQQVVIPNVRDTAYLKTVKWSNLNHFVKYYLFNPGNTTTDTSLSYVIKPIAIYSVPQHSFKYATGDSAIIKASQIKTILLTDTFNNNANIDGLFKINSEIAYRITPAILDNVLVQLTAISKKGAAPIIALLKKENFVQSISIIPKTDTAGEDIIHPAKKGIILKLKLKRTYWDLENIGHICTQLKQRKGVDDVFYADFYTGKKETETYYRVRAVKK